MAESRDALEKFGVTEDAMRAIQKSLAKLAGQGNLKDLVDLDEIHGSSSMTAAPLASDGENGITLFIVRFAAESTTPVHDHLTWGVIHVLEGRDRYIQWERTDDGSSEGHAELRVKKEQILMPGESVYWLAPPEDIHSQETMDEEVWELVIAGRDLMSEGVTHHRHYYDPAASTVSKAIEE
ncbi:MAG: hypothetical protein R3301_18315 [Saprospiraceae bacterium]|nr:hypothetical protein [Saprospiraceae bacterium]